jgi:hypothetical protein
MRNLPLFDVLLSQRIMPPSKALPAANFPQSSFGIERQLSAVKA